jgi:hypothetical protein
MFDRRFPNLDHLDTAPIKARRYGRRVLASVGVRGVKAAWDRYRGQVVFYLSDPSVCYPAIGGWNRDRSLDVPDDSETDEYIRMIHSAFVSNSERERRKSIAEKNEKQDTDLSAEKQQDEMIPERLSLLRHIRAKRRGVQKVVSA